MITYYVVISETKWRDSIFCIFNTAHKSKIIIFKIYIFKFQIKSVINLEGYLKPVV